MTYKQILEYITYKQFMLYINVLTIFSMEAKPSNFEKF